MDLWPCPRPFPELAQEQKIPRASLSGSPLLVTSVKDCAEFSAPNSYLPPKGPESVRPEAASDLSSLLIVADGLTGRGSILRPSSAIS